MKLEGIDTEKMKDLPRFKELKNFIEVYGGDNDDDIEIRRECRDEIRDLREEIAIPVEEFPEFIEEIESRPDFEIRGKHMLVKPMLVEAASVEDEYPNVDREDLEVLGEGYNIGCGGCEEWENGRDPHLDGISLNRGQYLQVAEPFWDHPWEHYAPTELAEGKACISCLENCDEPEKAAALLYLMEVYSE